MHWRTLNTVDLSRYWLREAKTWHLDITLPNVAICSNTLDDLGMPLQLLVLQPLQLNASAPVTSTREAMATWQKGKCFPRKRDCTSHLQWNEVHEADVSCEECCRTKWCRTCKHGSTDFNSNASWAGPVISVILFSQEQGRSRQPLRLLAVLLPLLLRNEHWHARISQDP